MILFERFIWNLNDVIRSISKNKKLLIYGYSAGGKYIEWLLNSKYNIQVDYIVDKSVVIYGKAIDRPLLFEYINNDNVVVLLTMHKTEDVKQYLEPFGYLEGINLFDLKRVFYGIVVPNEIGFFEWLEYKYDVDIIKELSREELGYASTDFLQSSPSRQKSIPDICMEFNISQHDAIFDFGCGKGGALILFSQCGFRKIGGVEYDQRIYDIIKRNFDKLKMNGADIIHGNAIDIKNLDSYNYFYFYNPFGASVMELVIRNIESSYQRVKRNIRIIYANPYCHAQIVKNNYFKLVKQIPSDFDCRLVNIYELSNF